MNSLVSPKPLSRGDVIGIAAPAGMVTDKSRFERGVRVLWEMGFEVKFPRDLWPGYSYLANTDENRAREFMSLIANEEVKAIIAARGGYGSLRILPFLDFDTIRRNPKPVVGFSDLTVLLGQLAMRSGLLCFHGPVVTSLADSEKGALERLYYCLTGQFRKSIKPDTLEVLRDGPDATGPLWGGNLSSLMTLIGTPYDRDWRGSVLFIEDVNEPLYKVDRMLTQLQSGGRLEALAGLIIGDFSFEDRGDLVERLRYTEAIWNRVLEVTQKEKYPVWGGFPTGHFHNNFTLPYGCQALMENNSGTLSFH